MQILNAILLSKSNRKELIRLFQQNVWDDKIEFNTLEQECLREIAYDLDFYEPDERLRNQDVNYYDDSELERRIKIVLKKLNSLK
ncbi:hypothetical protein [Deminuibacter soli]|uniref:Colicin immunity protein n=1 Tax=Deminuibacter soli TaxID=2291815 RepID=A0A3E1NFL2_9BACT|nr:hypothetical protein [Deminuibacter soli]RFM26760.1 hypothetical protein DXN05_17345 [Deminuibacter soli]